MTRFLANLKSSHSSSVFNHSHKIIAFPYSSQTTQPFQPKTFFRSNTKDTTLVPHLCNQKRFDEAIHILCQQNRLKEALQILHQIDKPSAPVYSTLIQSCIKSRLLQQGKRVHQHIKLSGFVPVSSALAAAAAVPCLRTGKEIHGYIMRTGLDSDEVVWSALSDMYGKCGSIEEARHIFDKMVDRDIVTWTAMIDRYFQDGRRKEGFDLFADLLRSGIRPNEFTFSGVLNACANQTSEELGKKVHGYMTRVGFDPFSFAASALVHMYSKCGNMVSAERVFKETPQADLFSWTSLIAGYAQNGQPDEAIRYFELLVKSGTQPDHITFVGVLSACAHAGLVDKGLDYFHSIKEQYGLTHTADHYACIIDLLARSGQFDEAENIISKMSMKPDKFLWASLLGGCRIHGNLKLAQRAAEALFEIEPENPATYVTLANIYATAGMWSEVAKIRKTMDDRGVVKKPGLSWIAIKRDVHVFLVGDDSHPKSKEINEFLGKLSKRMKEEGFVPDTNFVLHDVEDEQKEQNLSYHSEKLAVAFGIISTPEGTPIKWKSARNYHTPQYTVTSVKLELHEQYVL
ncbi:hypothetical protein POTOM_053888 [Populus tomentosa]|uniref:DYW domain-containing protein n=1 Tax=Populus tomentosa TaxID=118781 RepID=A0A8X8C7Z0_POPTO|nr:hypothetical protein POTOM_053888 [Populus tomentosa]